MKLILFYVLGFTDSSFSGLEEDLDLSNEGNLFNAMSFSYSLLIGISFSVIDASCLSVSKLKITSFTVCFWCRDQWNIGRNDPLC